MTTPPPQPPPDGGDDEEPPDEFGRRRRRDGDTEQIPPVRDEQTERTEHKEHTEHAEYRMGRADPDEEYVAGPPPPPYRDGPTYMGDPEGEEQTRRTTTTYIGDPRGPFRRPDISQEDLEGLHVDATGLPMGPRRVLPLEDEPSSLVARYLFPTERYRGEWKRHWVHLTGPVFIGALATLALGYLSGFLVTTNAPSQLATVAVVIWLFVIAWVAWQFADWWFDRFILTNKRVMVVKGIITRNVAMMPLQRVTDMKYEQSPLGRMLNYGTFVLESAGQEQALREVAHLPNPNELYLRVVEEMYEPQAVEARLGKDPDEVKADDGALREGGARAPASAERPTRLRPGRSFPAGTGVTTFPVHRTEVTRRGRGGSGGGQVHDGGGVP
jgi:membrane protein YdbS with pleckstrin-like domain